MSFLSFSVGDDGGMRYCWTAFTFLDTAFLFNIYDFFLGYQGNTYSSGGKEGKIKKIKQLKLRKFRIPNHLEKNQDTKRNILFLSSPLF